MIATSVFSVDDDTNIHADFHSNPVNYTKSVDNYITRLVFFVYIPILCTYTPRTGCGRNIALSTRSSGRQALVCDTKT